MGLGLSEGRCIFRGSPYDFVIKGVDGKETMYEIPMPIEYIKDHYRGDPYGTPGDYIQKVMKEEMNPDCVLLRYRASELKYSQAQDAGPWTDE